MSVQAMAYAIEQQIVREQTTQHVLLLLANYADENGDSVFPSVERIAKEARMNGRTVQRQIQKLLKLGILERSNPAIVAARIARADRRPICYRILMTTRTG